MSIKSWRIWEKYCKTSSSVSHTGGIVIIEVKDIVKAGSLDPRHVLIHKSYVDYVVKAEKLDNIALAYNPGMIGEVRVPTEGRMKHMPQTYNKIISRRSAMELKK